MMVYIAADQSLPKIAWIENAPAFYVDDLKNSVHEEAVRKHFSKPYVYYVGSYKGCGCGFKYGQLPVEEGQKGEESNARESVRRFSEYLAKVVEDGPIEVLACWDGEQGAALEGRSTITPVDVGGEKFKLREKHLLTVVKRT